MDSLSGDRVREVEVLGVEQIATIAREAGQVIEGLTAGTIKWIASEGMADRREMDSNLVRASGMKANGKCGGALASGENCCGGIRRLAGGVGGPNETSFRVGYAADGRPDFVGIPQGGALCPGTVDFFDIRLIPASGQSRGGRLCFSEQDDASGSAAEAVDGVRAGDLLLDEMEKRVFEEAAAGKGGQASWLVDGQEVGVFPEKFKVLWRGRLGPGRTAPD